MTLAPGIYTEVTADRYHADPCETPSLSASMAAVIVKQSPAHAFARHPRLGGQPGHASKAMAEGSLIHALLLGQESTIARIEAPDFRTKKAQAERDEAVSAGLLPVLAAQLDEAQQTASKLRTKLAGRGYILDGQSEVTLVWDELADDGTPVRCRGRVDHLKLADGLILDLKKSISAHPDKCVRSFTDYSYEIQHSAYCSALRTLVPEFEGRERMIYLFLELDSPFVITPFAPAGTMRRLGELRWRRAINTWAQCIREKRWPEYTDGIVFGDAPIYELRKEGIDEYTEI